MEINFFEEYPTKETISKLKLLAFKTRLYLGTRSVKEFLDFRKELKTEFKNVKEVIYWPLLSDDEGYWFSAFSKKEALTRIFRDIENSKASFRVLLDLEIPMNNKALFITEIQNYLSSRKLIQDFIKQQSANHAVIVAQLPWYDLRRYLLDFVATGFPFNSYHRLDMIYTSFLVKDKQNYLRKAVKIGKKSYRNYSVGLGIIAEGEDKKRLPFLQPNDLVKDLAILKEEEIKEAIIYRLGGVNKDFLKVISSFA